MTTRTPKRKLSNIDFSKEGAHVALVSKDQGGPANGHNYALVLKANNFSEEFIKKVQQVQVTLELPVFLRTFFDIYGSQADILAGLMGYVAPETNDDQTYEDYIQAQIDSFVLMKSLNEDFTEVSKLSEDEYMSVVLAQAKLEKVLEQYDEKNSASAGEGSTEAVTKVKESDDKSKAKVDPSGDNNQELEKSMTTPNVEMVEKSALENVEKSLADTKEELTKALEKVALFEAAQKEAVVKSKMAVLKDAVKEDKYVEAIAKAALSLETDAEFDAFVAVVKELANKVDESELFKEKGASSTEEINKSTESPVAKAIKAQQKSK